jgi:hypothetical protein
MRIRAFVVIIVMEMFGTTLLRFSTNAQTLQPSFEQSSLIESKLVANLSDSSILFFTRYLSNIRKADDPLQPWQEAELQAKNNRKAFEAALALSVNNPNLFGAAVSGGDSSAAAASLARTAQKVPNFAEALAPFANDKLKLKKAVEIGNNLAEIADAIDKSNAANTFIEIFAEGNIRGVATGSTNDGGAGNGALGIRLRNKQLLWNASVNIASTQDTLKQGFGENILLVGNGTNGISFLADIRYEKYHLHGYLGSSKSTWNLSPRPDTSVYAKATVIGMGITFFKDIVRGRSQQNDITLSFEAGFAIRHLAGDVKRHETLVNAVLENEDDRTFYGLEFGSQITFGSITAATSLFWMKGGSITGLSSAQLAAGLRIAAPIFKGTL